MPPERAQGQAGARAPEYREAWATAVAKALSHPLRFNILRAVEAAGSMSPSRIASDFSQDLPKLSYHVRELSGAGLLSRTRTRPVRGAIENFYELTPAGRVAIQAVDAVLELDPTRGG